MSVDVLAVSASTGKRAGLTPAIVENVWGKASAAVLSQALAGKIHMVISRRCLRAARLFPQGSGIDESLCAHVISPCLTPTYPQTIIIPNVGAFSNGSGGSLAYYAAGQKLPSGTAQSTLSGATIAADARVTKEIAQAVLSTVGTVFAGAIAKGTSANLPLPGIGALRYSGSARTTTFTPIAGGAGAPKSSSAATAASGGISAKATSGGSSSLVRSGAAVLAGSALAKIGGTPAPVPAPTPSATGSRSGPAVPSIKTGASSGGPKYSDPDFPPGRSSLCHDWSMCPSASQWGKLVWKRATEFTGTDTPAVFFDGIDPSDVKQGMLGDCYFLSSLSVLAEVPARIQRLFVTPEGNAQGKYTVQWYQNGIQTIVTVDDYFPCDPTTGQPAFTRCHGPELWVMILEKAWAKLHGSYQNIEGGNAADVISALTGAPYTTYKLQGERGKKPPNYEAIWSEMAGAEISTFVLTAAVPDDPSVDMMAVDGLVEGHAYGILDVRDVKGVARLVKLRNPWGNTEWNGAWSDNSPQWTPALKKALGWTAEDDGTFWMEFNDFKRLFSEVSIIRVRDDYTNTFVRLPTLSVGALVGVSLTVSTPTNLCIELHQSSKRCFPKEQFTFQYGGLVLEVIATSPAAVVATSEHARDDSVFEDVTLSPGRYIVLCRGSVDSKRTCALSAYSSSPVTLSLLSSSTADLEALATPAYALAAKSAGSKLKFSGVFADVDAYEYHTGAVTALYYANNMARPFSCTVVLDTTNMALVGKSGSSAPVSLAPGASTVIVVRLVRPGEAFGLGYKHEDLRAK